MIRKDREIADLDAQLAVIDACDVCRVCLNGADGYSVIAGTGAAHYDEIVKELKDAGIEPASNVDVRAYIKDMHVCI